MYISHFSVSYFVYLQDLYKEIKAVCKDEGCLQSRADQGSVHKCHKVDHTN